MSVIIPAFNAAAFVADAIESVLAQTYSPLECIVVDDGSTDATLEIARGYRSRVKAITQRHSGVAAARNRGIREADGEILVLLDADDVWLPDRVSKLVTALRDSRAWAALTAATVVDRGLRPLYVYRTDPPPDPRSMLLWVGGISVPSSIAVTRACLDSVGAFDERLSTGADWELLLRIVTCGSLAYVDEPLILYRVHAGSMSTNPYALERDMRLIYAGAFSRDAGLVPIRRRAHSRLHWNLAYQYGRAGVRSRRLWHLAASIAWHPPTGLRSAYAGVRRRLPFVAERAP